MATVPETEECKEPAHPVASSQLLRKTLDWIAQEYEHLEAENQVLRASLGTGKVVDNLLRSAGDSDQACAWPPIPGSVEDGGSGSKQARNVIAEMQATVAAENKLLDPAEVEAQRQGRLLALKQKMARPEPLFADLDGLRCKVKDFLKTKPIYKVEDLYHRDGIWQALAQHKYFDNFTFVVIALNAVWLAIDTDHNHEDVLLDAHPVFITAEQLFCTFFTFELLVRFLAFEKKLRCLSDMWFVFDLTLVTLMVLETWVLFIFMAASASSRSGGTGLGSTSVLKLAKMLRVVRMLRVARLMRSCPEFFILIKAIGSASRATFFTVSFLFVILYVYAIAFTLILQDTEVGTELFSSVSVSMQTLFFQVTMADGIADVTQKILDESMVAMIALGTVILIATITLMNTLIGVLCEAITAVAEHERMAMQIALVDATLREILEEGDTDHDGSISKDEFIQVVNSRTAVLALEDIGIDVVGLAETADYFFEQHNEIGSDYSKRLLFDDFMQLLLQLRGSNKATVKDVVDLRKHMHKILRNLDDIGLIVATLASGQESAPRPDPVKQIQ